MHIDVELVVKILDLFADKRATNRTKAMQISMFESTLKQFPANIQKQPEIQLVANSQSLETLWQRQDSNQDRECLDSRHRP